MELRLFTNSPKGFYQQLADQDYNNLRSHHYAVYCIAKNLGVTHVTDTGTTPGFTKAPLSSDLYYTEHQFPEYRLNTDRVNTGKTIGVIFHCLVPENLTDLMKFLCEVDYLIYYSSDLEFNNSQNLKLMLQYMHKNQKTSIGRLFNNKLKLILLGLGNQVEIIRRKFKVPVIYLPQLINPNIPIHLAPKIKNSCYLINNSKNYYSIVKEVLDKGYLVTMSVNHQEANIKGALSIYNPNLGTNLMDQLRAVSSSEYYLVTDTNLAVNADALNEPYATHSHTFKYLECYYTRTFPIDSSKTLPQILKVISRKPDINKFIDYMEKNYSVESYKDTFNLINNILTSYLNESKT